MTEQQNEKHPKKKNYIPDYPSNNNNSYALSSSILLLCKRHHK